jgi:hypothetical protein
VCFNLSFKRYQVGTLTRDSPTAGSGDPALCELQVPLTRWIAPGKSPFPGLRGGYTGLVGFEVLTAVVMKSNIFWDITPCSLLKVNRRFGGTHHLHLQGQKMNRAKYQRESRWQAELFITTCLHDDILLRLFFDPEYRSDIFLRNVCLLSKDDTALYPRRNKSSQTGLVNHGRQPV